MNIYKINNEKFFNEIKELIISNPKGYPSILSHKKQYLLDWINEKLDFLKDKKIKLKTKIYYLINGYTDFEKCVICKKPILRDVISVNYGFCEHGSNRPHCSYKCTKNDPKRTEKYKKTCLKKYGVEFFTQTNIQKEKSKITKEKRHRR